jgi:hypothetical protein
MLSHCSSTTWGHVCRCASMLSCAYLCIMISKREIQECMRESVCDLSPHLKNTHRGTKQQQHGQRADQRMLRLRVAHWLQPKLVPPPLPLHASPQVKTFSSRVGSKGAAKHAATRKVHLICIYILVCMYVYVCSVFVCWVNMSLPLHGNRRRRISSSKVLDQGIL